MLFEDPIQTISVELPAGWTYNPFDSTLTDFYFNCWDQPDKLVGVHVRPTSIPQEQSDEQWFEKIRSEAGSRASLTEMTTGGGCAAVADFSPGRGLAQRVVFMRGPRVELVIEQRNTGPESKTPWAALERAVQTAFSAANLKEPERRGANEFSQFIDAANEAFEKDDIPAVMNALEQAVQVGISAWLFSLLPPVSSPELHAAARVAQAMLHLSGFTGNLSLHRGAESVLRRALSTLEGMGPAAKTQPLMTELAETLNQLNAEILEETEEKETFSPILALRERSFRLAHAASQALESADLENAYQLSGMAAEDLLSLVAYLRRNQPLELSEEIARHLSGQGISDPEAQREALQKAREALLFPPLSLSLQIRYGCAPERADDSASEAADILAHMSELLYEANPGNAGIILAHALALMNRAGALALQPGGKCLSEAEQCLDKAAHALESLEEPHAGEDRWIQYHDRQIDRSLQAIDQRLSAISEGKDPASGTGLTLIRSQFQTIAGRFREKAGSAG